MEASLSAETSVKFLPGPHDVIFQKTVVCMFTAISATSLTLINKRNEFMKSVEDILFGRHRLFFLLL
jgi:hypothetical protein